MARKNYHTDNKSFIIYKDWERYVGALDDEQAGQLIKALFAFAARGDEPELEPMAKMAFMFMSDQIERDGAGWEDTCEKNKTNGKKGGRKKTERFSEEPKKADTETDTDTDTDTETDTDTDTDTDTETDIDTECEKSVPSVGRGEENFSRLSDEQRLALISKSSEKAVSDYLHKLESWEKRKGKRCADVYGTISKWIDEDRKKAAVKARDKPSYDLDEFEEFAKGFVLRTGNNTPVGEKPEGSS